MKRVRVRAPCSTSNLGPGYDVVGLALDAFYDTVEIRLSKGRGIEIELEGADTSGISTRPEENTAGLAAMAIMKRFGEVGLSIRIIKGIPPRSGLGSSGASAAATAVAMNRLLDLNLTNETLSSFAAEGERAAAGAAHGDNVTPSIFGGLTIIRSYKPLRVLALPSPDADFVIAVPRGVRKSTKEARAVLPKAVDLGDLVANTCGTATLLAGLLKSDPALIGEGMMNDAVIEPARRMLYPGYLHVKEVALANGALGVTLSGAGPSVIAIVDPDKDSAALARAVKEAFESKGVSCESYVTRPARGAVVLP